MIFSACSILDLNETFAIEPTDEIEMIGLEVINNQEMAILIHKKTNNKFFKQLYEINFLLGED